MPTFKEPDEIAERAKQTEEISLALLSKVEPQPTWLENPASEGTFSASVEDGTLRLEVREPTKGMKWSLPLPKPVDLSRTSYIILYYKAEGVKPLSDYLLYLGPERVTGPEREYHAVKLSNIVPDGKWHTLCHKLRPYKCTFLAFQVQAEDGPAQLWLRPLLFSSHPVEVSERLPNMLSLSLNPSEAVIRPPDVKLFDLSGWMNTSLRSLLPNLAKGDRFPAKIIVAEGIPFQVSDTHKKNTIKISDSTGYVEFPVDERVSEVYMILALKLPVVDEPSYGGGGVWRIVRPHRVCAEVEYADGTTDKCLPYRIRSGRHEVIKGLDVYCVPANPAKIVRTIKVKDGLTLGSIGVCGLTLNLTEERLYPEAATLPPPIKVNPLLLPAPSKPMAGVSNSIAFIKNAYLKLDISIERGFLLRRLSALPAQKDVLLESAPLFEIESGGRRLTSEDFRVENVQTQGDRLSILLIPAVSGFPEIEFTIKARETPVLTFSVKLINRSSHELRPHFQLLHTLPVKIGEGDWYFYPAKSAVLSRKLCNFRFLYGGDFPLQFLSLFNPEEGFGLYVLVRDRDGLTKWFLLRREPTGGTRMGVEFLLAPIPAEGLFNLPLVDLGLNSGDWHGAFEAYKRWVKTWYRPIVERKRWFREVFFFRQDSIGAGLYNPNTKTYQFRRRVKSTVEAFGGCDYLHISDWGMSGRRGRTGDYDPWVEVIPGPGEFRQAIKELQKMGIPVGLYIEGYLVDRHSNVGKAHLEEWGMKNEYREFIPNRPGCSEFMMCPMVQTWQDYLAGIYRRVAEESGALGFYIDEFGFAGRWCYAEEHGHPVPCQVLRGEKELTRKVRISLPKECVVYTEETPCDTNSQFQDGSFTYCVNAGQTWMRPYLPVPLKLFRFVFPDFKTFEIIVCDRPTGSNVEAVKQAFFNGEGLWLQGEPENWFTPETLRTIRKCLSLLKEHKEAIASNDVEPFVPTLVGGVFANKFRGRKETVWILYNSNPITVRGPVLSVKYVKGAKYFDLWNEREVVPKIKGEKAFIFLEISPHDVGMIVRSVP